VEACGRTQTRFAKGGGSYLSSSDRRHVIGLGKVDRIDQLEVFWPSGKKETWDGLAVDQYWRLYEGKRAPELLPISPKYTRRDTAPSNVLKK
jgi:hypothetical protein